MSWWPAEEDAGAPSPVLVAIDELHVTSNVLVYRIRPWESGTDIFCGERQDVLRRIDGRWRLASRLILLDQAVLGARDVSIIL